MLPAVNPHWMGYGRAGRFVSMHIDGGVLCVVDYLTANAKGAGTGTPVYRLHSFDTESGAAVMESSGRKKNT